MIGVITVGELKEKLNGVDDDLEVVIETKNRKNETNTFNVSFVETLGTKKVKILSDELDMSVKIGEI